jgi:hypothetical protein
MICMFKIQHTWLAKTYVSEGVYVAAWFADAPVLLRETVASPPIQKGQLSS